MYPTLLLAVSLIASPAIGSDAATTTVAATTTTAAARVLAPAPIPAPVNLAAPNLAAVVAAPVRVAKKVEPKVVTFETEDGLKLTGDYFAPKDSKSRAPAAILVHDAGGDRRQMTLFAEKLNKSGLAVLVPDFRGHGSSATKKLDWAKLNEKERDKMWSFTPRDLDAASSWLSDRKEVQGTNLTIVGLRAGCALSVYHAGRNENIRAVVLIEPASKPQLGFDLCRDIASLGGLAIKVVTSRDNEQAAVSIQFDATRANDGLECVEIDLCKSKGEDLLHDRRVASNVAKWVKAIAFPKRGRGRK